MKLTREGKRFFLASGLIGIAAFNTGNNLIYLILSMMLALFVLSVMVPRINMKRTGIRVFQMGPVFANNPADITLTVTNSKSFPAYSIRVVQSGTSDCRAYFPYIPAVSETSKTVRRVFHKRGIYRQGDFFIESEFPFIFVSRKIPIIVEGEVLVYPELKDVEGISADFSVSDDGSISMSGRHEDEFAMIREFRYGDDRRRIHWKASAKADKLLVMEYAAAEVQKLTIIFDNMLPQDAGIFEKAVSFTASVAEKFLRDGYFVRLVTCGKVIPFGSGVEHLYKILDQLAVIGLLDAWDCPAGEKFEGMTILILGSGESPLGRFIPQSNVIIHADTL